MWWNARKMVSPSESCSFKVLGCELPVNVVDNKPNGREVARQESIVSPIFHCMIPGISTHIQHLLSLASPTQLNRFALHNPPHRPDSPFLFLFTLREKKGIVG